MLFLVAAASLGGAWAFTATMRMAFLESGYPVTVAKRTLLDQCDLGELVVLGDSRGEASIIPAKLPMPGTNLALGATGPVEGYFIARKLLRCPHPPRFVLYVPSIVGYQTLGEGLWQRAAKYGLVSFADLRAIADVAAKLHDPSVAAVDTNDGLTGTARDLAYSLGFPSIFASSVLDARFIGRYESNLHLLQAVAAARGHVVYPDGPGGAIVGMDAKLDHFAPEPVETYYFEATLRLLSKAGIHTFVLPIPVADATYAALRPAVQRDVVRYLATHTEGMPMVTDAFLAVPRWPDRLFVDGSHMNAAGAEAFSDRLGQCVGAWLSDPCVRCDLTWQPSVAAPPTTQAENPHH